MKTLVQNANLVLLEAVATTPPKAWTIPDQTVAIHKAGTLAIIGIDGHTSAWDELVTINWAGSHLTQLERISQVEIRDMGMNLLESLPVDLSRRPYEKDGDTVFFLTEAE